MHLKRNAILNYFGANPRDTEGAEKRVLDQKYIPHSANSASLW